MIKAKWHNISIKTTAFEDIQKVQRLIPIQVSIPQTIEWLTKFGLQELNNKKDKSNGTKSNSR